MTESELRTKYRTAKLAASLECGNAKAAEAAKKLSRLTDEQFEVYTAQTARTLADIKAKTGVSGVVPPKQERDQPDLENVRASVLEYIDDVFDLDDEDGQGR